ncbi:MAG: Thiamine-phosphate synthase [Dehalococcoidia bacterium]|nr:Thiamine-phosphate synthase [Chloroflexota bacterium]MBT9159222.1 Thiamine-phosphate synthase [Chloroflexota bacterium]
MLRIIDANLDRLGEGLRVLEDIARFVLEDIRITEKLRRMRHELIAIDPALKSRLLAARDSVGDVGRGGAGGGDRKRLIDVVTANAKRAQESLRVLEELAKLPQVPAELRERRFEEARFTLYEIERELALRLARQDRRNRVAGLYVIIDAQTLGASRESRVQSRESGREGNSSLQPPASSLSEAEAARQVIQGGARVIQLRDKHRSKRELIPLTRELRQICAEAGVLFIVNDYVDLALATDADGVHLGQNDLPVPLAREILPLDKIIGCSARTVELALKAQEEGADYIGVGSIYSSPTKPSAEVIGLGRLRDIRNAVSLPVVALGGVNESNVGEVLEAGADSVAVIDAVLNAEDTRMATHRLVAKCSPSNTSR